MARMTLEQCRQKVLELLDGISELSQEDAVQVIQDLGKVVASETWDTGGGFGAGATAVIEYRGRTFFDPGAGWEYITGPAEEIADLGVELRVTRATRELHSGVPLAEIPWVWDPEIAPESVIIDGTERTAAEAAEVLRTPMPEEVSRTTLGGSSELDAAAVLQLLREEVHDESVGIRRCHKIRRLLELLSVDDDLD